MENRTALTRERALELLGVQTVPGGEENCLEFLNGIRWLIAKYGEEWVREHRVRLVEESIILAEF